MSHRTYRHEMKYYINALGLRELKTRLRLSMDRDPFADDAGNYHVRSLYFDDAYDRASLEKLAGTTERKKYRLRIYDFDEGENVRLECKQKRGNAIYKRSQRMDARTVDVLLWNEISAGFRRGAAAAREGAFRAAGG
jgi:VTC domain.